jgi:hypothetical protein
MSILLKSLGIFFVLAAGIASGQDTARKPINLNEFSYRFTGG